MVAALYDHSFIISMRQLLFLSARQLVQLGEPITAIDSREQDEASYNEIGNQS